MHTLQHVLVTLTAIVAAATVAGCGSPPLTQDAGSPSSAPNTSAPAQPGSAGEEPRTTVAEPPQALPAFPWPPPRYSAFSKIDRRWVAPGAQPTLGVAADRLERAFNAAGYGESSYYRVPGGFALVSRIEQIRADATPIQPPARWTVETPPMHEGLIDYIRALFNAPPGFYRVIVFVVTDQDFAAGERPPTSSEAQEWITGGSLRLPESVSAAPFTAQHYATALVYEFERRRDEQEARVRTPSGVPGRVHLEKAGLWQALAGQ